MQNYRQAFIQFALDQGVLRFGEFTLKSGRKSPYFFNSGLFNNGWALAELGRFYAQALLASGVEFDMLFGPAYKGIPLVTATAMALADHHGRNVPWCFNRKEAKDHGEGGSLVGAPLAGRVVIVDDVITAGTAIGESVAIIRAACAVPVSVLIALDRQECGAGELSAVDEAAQRHGVSITSIATLDDLIAHLIAGGDPTTLAAVQAYRERYAVRALPPS